MERADELKVQAAKELGEAKDALLKAGREAREAAVARRDKEQKEVGAPIAHPTARPNLAVAARVVLRRCGACCVGVGRAASAWRR